MKISQKIAIVLNPVRKHQNTPEAIVVKIRDFSKQILSAEAYVVLPVTKSEGTYSVFDYLWTFGSNTLSQKNYIFENAAEFLLDVTCKSMASDKVPHLTMFWSHKHNCRIKQL